jgi:hypothetical protein
MMFELRDIGFSTAIGIARYGGMRLRGRPRPRFNLRDVFPFFR